MGKFEIRLFNAIFINYFDCVSLSFYRNTHENNILEFDKVLVGKKNSQNYICLKKIKLVIFY